MRRVIDGQGAILAPGFVDMHTGVMLLAEPHHASKMFQGVTLELLGQDGLSYAPVEPAGDERCRASWRSMAAGTRGPRPGEPCAPDTSSSIERPA